MNTRVLVGRVIVDEDEGTRFIDLAAGRPHGLVRRSVAQNRRWRAVSVHSIAVLVAGEWLVPLRHTRYGSPETWRCAVVAAEKVVLA